MPPVVQNRAEFDALLRSCTNYETLPAFHQGRVRTDLTRMVRYVERLGHPERAAPVVHVTGTKGKGSTACIAARLLSAHGGPVGLHTSPHLHRMEERVAVDFQPLGEQDLLQATNEVLAAATAEPPLEFPTYFELMTLVAFLEFRRRQVRYAVHEVGMGGALDATNVVRPAVTVVTNVSLEHVLVLGRTVPEIAREKAGIVKPGAPLLTAVPAGDPAEPVLMSAAERAGVPCLRLGREIVLEQVERRAGGGLRLAVRTWRGVHAELETPLLGFHQAENVALAIGVMDALMEQEGRRSDPAAVRRALAGCRLPARLETVGHEPRVVVDGAHTPGSIARALAEARYAFAPARTVVVFAIAEDKDRDGAARALAGADHVITTRYDSPRALAPELLAATVTAAGGRAEPVPDLGIALDRARGLAERKGLVLVLGSLYLAAAVRARCRPGDGAEVPSLEPIAEGLLPWNT